MVNKQLEKFPEGILEHISKIIGEYRTGSEITELFNIAGYPEIKHDGSTKWRFVYEVFKFLNNKQPYGQYEVAKVIQAFCDPTQWIGKENDWKQAMNKINKALIYMNIQVSEEGKLIATSRKIMFPVEEQNNYGMPIQNEPLKNFPVFKTGGIKQDEKLCFVLMPFKNSFDRIYKEQIKPTVESLGLKCVRADEIFSPTSVLEDIWTHILKSKVIIADVTGKNPNVFYEMGIAHTIGRPVIIITQNKEDVPFDIAQYRYFLYSDDKKGWEKLRENISLALRSVIKK